MRLAMAALLTLIGTTPAAACMDSHRFDTFSLPAPALGHAKRILVYLPPGYDCSDVRYPVLYANDGHDLFAWDPFAAAIEPTLAPEIADELAAHKAWYGSWRLGAQLDQAIAAGDLPPLMAVGIAADDGQRSRDLAPVPWDGSAEARGEAYGAFVAGTVVEVVDSAYRTVADRRCRVVGGASLGAVSALQIGLAYGDRFGMVLALSPVLRDPAIAAFVAAHWRAGDRAGPKILIDFDDDPIGRADRAWFESMDGATRYRHRATLAQTPGGQHNIASWAERVLPALERLLDRRCLD
jgi:predicted alpha/beta superfamily hydrolase